MLPKNWIVSAGLLVGALVGIIAIQSTLSKKPGSISQTAVHKRVNWCGESLSGIEMPGQFLLKQQGAGWQVGDRKIEAIEPWLGKYCELDLMLLGNTGSSAMLNDYLNILYKNKKNESFQIDPTGSFAWQGQLFHSPQFNKAIAELHKIIQNR